MYIGGVNIAGEKEQTNFGNSVPEGYNLEVTYEQVFEHLGDVTIISVTSNTETDDYENPLSVGSVGVSAIPAKPTNYLQIGPIESPLQVDPSHQRKGIGTALVAAAIEHIATLGIQNPIIQIPVSEETEPVIEYILAKIGVMYECHKPNIDKSGELSELGYYQLKVQKHL